ncbi:Hypothetical protein A7982_04993 [Minicystis rosea]|nr:Hypothetical protein A7982_04993 [Minicystis rosea]
MNGIRVLGGAALISLGGCILLYDPGGYSVGSGGAGGGSVVASSSTGHGGTTSSTGGAGGDTSTATATAASTGVGGCPGTSSSSSSGAGCMGMAGVCVAVPIGAYDTASEPRYLAVAGSRLYGVKPYDGNASTLNGEVWAIPLPGSSTTSTYVAVKGMLPLSFSANEHGLFWLQGATLPTSSMGVMQAPLDAKNLPLGTTLYDTAAASGAVYAFGGTLFFAINGTDTKMGRQPIGCGGLDAEVRSLGSDVNTSLLAADDQYVYYDTVDTIRRVSVTDFETTQPFVPANKQILSLAVDASPQGLVYWTQLDDSSNGGRGSVHRATKASPPQPDTIITDRLRPRGIISDGKSIYWIEGPEDDCKSATSTIQHWPALTSDGDGGTDFASGLRCPTLAQDAGHVYWTSGGTIYAIEKQ